MTAQAAATCHCRLERGAFVLEVGFELPARGIVGLFGRSGAGKTTLLRCLAGLERAVTGSVEVNGEIWHDTQRGVWQPPHRRSVAYVFQDARLFPHMSVERNLRFALRRNVADGPVAWQHVVELLALGALLQRRPDQLSAGERQRVAIGRALLRSPRLVLMDEPLAALDGPRKREILPFLQRLHAELDVPMMYVTHSIEEASALCDELFVMEDGRLRATGALHEVLARTDVPVLAGDEAGVVVSAEAVGYDASYDLTRVRFDGGELTVPGRHEHLLRLRVMARDVSLTTARPAATTILNVLPAAVREVACHDGPFATVQVATGSTLLLARITRRSLDHLALRPGSTVFAQIKAVAVKSFDPDRSGVRRVS